MRPSNCSAGESLLSPQDGYATIRRIDGGDELENIRKHEPAPEMPNCMVHSGYEASAVHERRALLEAQVARGVWVGFKSCRMGRVGVGLIANSR